MKCEWVEQNLVLYVYDELADDARYELEQHVARCADCAAKLKANQAFHARLSQLPVQEPSPNLLTASRMRLQESLETAEQGGFWQKLTFDPGAWLREVRFAPALAAMILMLGFAGGVGATYKVVSERQANAVVPAMAPAESSITGIRSVSQEPGSDKINIRYDTTSIQEAQGSMSDQRIQQLLLYAARNNSNSGVRIDSVDILTKNPQDPNVREALIYALRYDSNPGVRLKALEGVGPFVKGDTRVRNAVLEALLNDNNTGMRTQALHLLGPVRADGSVRQVLYKLAESDSNQYIRSQARTQLAQLPEID
jgi:HEAT repeats/Putative zinc-finger